MIYFLTLLTELNSGNQSLNEGTGNHRKQGYKQHKNCKSKRNISFEFERNKKQNKKNYKPL